MHGQRVLAAFLAVLAVVPRASAVTIETVPVGNSGNVPVSSYDSYPGAVEYDYRIGKYEVTNAQYVDFLNAVDSAGANKLALYSNSMSTDTLGGIVRNSAAANGLKYEVKAGRESNPVVFVSLYDAVRFTNWLQNGQGSGDTESGAYTLLGSTPRPSNFQSIIRNLGAKWWLPNSNEVYKATYHKNDGATANYWDYPISSNAIPASDQPPGSGAPVPANTANFLQDDGLANGYNDGYAVTGSPSFSNTQNYLTNVGAYPLSKSPSGAFDLGGNVAEWRDAESLSFAGFGGATWGSHASVLRANPNGGGFSNPLMENSSVGFRVAAFPESPGAPVHQIAVDFDSSNFAVANVPTPGPLATQPSFLSWNTSWAFTSITSTGAKFVTTQLLTQGVEFELKAFRAAPGPETDPPYLGSRIRSNRGGQINPLLQDFVFAEGTPGTFLYLTVAGLPEGTYRMTTWHYDPDFGSGTPPNYMQIEVGDKQGSAIAAATTVVADHFPLSTLPRAFEFQVTSANIVKEIIFRNDDTSPGGNNYRTRLNGFTLVRVPEPSTLLTAVFMFGLFFAGRGATVRDSRRQRRFPQLHRTRT